MALLSRSRLSFITKNIVGAYTSKLHDALIDIETIPFRPEDFVFEDPFVREILETGTRLI